jgi:hypothetical protein
MGMDLILGLGVLLFIGGHLSGHYVLIVVLLILSFNPCPTLLSLLWRFRSRGEHITAGGRIAQHIWELTVGAGLVGQG